MRRAVGAFFITIALIGCLAFTSGCAQVDLQSRTIRTSQEALATMSIARSHYRRSRISMRQSRPDDALKELTQVTQLSFPKAYYPGLDLVMDAWAQKAMLLLKLKRSEQALKAIEKGISYSRKNQPSFYKAHLEHVHGRVLEKLNRDKEALSAYQRSIELNQAVIRNVRKGMRSRRIRKLPAQRRLP